VRKRREKTEMGRGNGKEGEKMKAEEKRKGLSPQFTFQVTPLFLYVPLSFLLKYAGLHRVRFLQKALR